MSTILQIQGRLLPLLAKDIDTDRIIPARFLRCVTFDGLGEHVFADDRTQLQAAGKTHPFDDPRNTGAKILLTDSNFGCGSSREHAPQALQKWGLQAIIAESFAEIFFNNALAIGLPCVRLTSADLQQLHKQHEEQPSLEVCVDLARQQVIAANTAYPFQMPESARQMLMRGLWDATGQLLANLAQVRQRAAEIPYLQGFVA